MRFNIITKGVNQKPWIITIVLLFAIQIGIMAQNQTVTIKATNAPVSDIFKKIKTQTNLSVIYNTEDVNPSKKITINAVNQPLSKVLDNIMSAFGSNVAYVIQDNYIVINKQSQKTGSNTGTADQPKREISGKIVDEKNEPVIGAGVWAQGTNSRTATDMNGNFTLSVAGSNTLVITYIGLATQTVDITGTNKVNVTMHEDSKLMDEVVVTALGIKRSEKALSYNVQQIQAEELTNVKDANFMNSLAGKVAGVNINASSVGIGGATRVVMRGPKSINQSNQALYVIDGVPIFNVNKGEINQAGRYG